MSGDGTQFSSMKNSNNFSGASVKTRQLIVLGGAEFFNFRISGTAFVDNISGNTNVNQLTLLGHLITNNNIQYVATMNQHVSTTSTPTFAGMILGAPLGVSDGGTGQSSYTDGQLLIGNTTGNTLDKATLTGTADQIIITNGNGIITLSTPQDIAPTSSPTFASLTLTTPLAPSEGGTGVTSYTDGQILIGNSFGGGLVKNTIAGTTDQIIVTNGSGIILLSTPQDIATNSAVNFGSVNGLEITIINTGGSLRNLLMTDNNPTLGATIDDVTAIGIGALASVTTGGNACTAIGSNALTSLTTATSCTAVGHGALESITTIAGFTSTGVGFNAGVNCTRRIDAIGYVAGACATTSTLNTFIGMQCGQFGTYSGGGSCVFIGALAVFHTLTSAANCVVIGKSAGGALQDAVGTTLIGFNANVSGAGIDNSIGIGSGVVVSASNRITIGGSSATSMEYAGTNFNTDGLVVSSSHLISSTTTLTTQITFSGGILTNTIFEESTGVGVTIEEVNITDNIITSSTQNQNLVFNITGSAVVQCIPVFEVDDINERTLNAGVTIDGILMKDLSITAVQLIAPAGFDLILQSTDGIVAINDDCEINGTLLVTGIVTLSNTLKVDSIIANTTNGDLTISGNGAGNVVSTTPMTIDSFTDIRNGVITTDKVAGNNNDDLILAAGAGGGTFIILDDTTKVDTIVSKSGFGIDIESGNINGETLTFDFLQSGTTDTDLTLSGNGTGVVKVDDILKVNTINEKTAANGVDIDTAKIKDGSIHLIEKASQDTPASGYGAVYFNSSYTDPIMEWKDDAGGIHGLGGVFGSMHIDDSSTATVINVANVEQCFTSPDTLAGSQLRNVSYITGGIFTFTGGTNIGGGIYQLTGLTGFTGAVGDIMSIATSGGSYNGVYSIFAATTTTVNIVHADAGSESGDIQLADQLKVEVPGTYDINMNNGCSSATANTSYHYSLNVTTLDEDEVSNTRKFGTSGDIGSIGFGGIVNFAAGDRISMTITNLSNAANITVNHWNMNLARVG